MKLFLTNNSQKNIATKKNSNKGRHMNWIFSLYYLSHNQMKELEMYTKQTCREDCREQKAGQTYGYVGS